jgi:hypothetical protein
MSIKDEARNRAWQTFEPKELRDSKAGLDVDERLLQLADEVMDHVAIAEAVELELKDSKTRLSVFVNNQVVNAEEAIREERAASTFERSFREAISSKSEQAVADQAPERLQAADEVLRTPNNPTARAASPIERASAGRIASQRATVVIEGDRHSGAVAQEANYTAVYSSLEERDALEQDTIARLTGDAAEKYEQLKAGLAAAEVRFQEAVLGVDQKTGELRDARADLAIEQRLEEFREISLPAVVQINNYLKETTLEGGIDALLDPSRHDEHVDRVAKAILDSARENGIALGQTVDGLRQVNQIAINLFNTLSTGMERANQEFARSHQLIHQRETTQVLDHSLTQTSPVSLTPAAAMHNDHDAHASLDKRQRDREQSGQQLPGQAPGLQQNRDQYLGQTNPALDSNSSAGKNFPTRDIAAAKDIGEVTQELAALLAL